MTKIDKYKTLCCQAAWYRESRANLRCEKCDKDVTLEVTLLYQATQPSEQMNRCKHIKRIGESCMLNNNCKYPDCE